MLRSVSESGAAAGGCNSLVLNKFQPHVDRNFVGDLMDNHKVLNRYMKTNPNTICSKDKPYRSRGSATGKADGDVFEFRRV